MAQIEIKKARVFPSGEQFFPITHTKAVIDDNGYTAESRLGAMQDEINNLQEGVVVVGEGMTPVPSDLAPTENSSNWVTSGGVYNAIQNVQSEVTELEGEVFNSVTGLFEKGSIDTSNYAEVESTDRLRNIGLVDIIEGATITLNVPFSFAYGYRVFLYNNGVANSYIDRNTSGDSFTGNQTIPIQSSAAYNQFRVVIFPKSTHTFTDSEASGTTISVVGVSLSQRIEDCENILTVDGDEKFAFHQQQASSSSTAYITPTSSATDSSYTFTIKATGGTTGRLGYISLPSLTEGKKYRLSFNYVNELGADATVSFRNSSKNLIVALGYLVSGASGNFSYEFTHDGNISYIGFIFLQVAKDNYLTISNVSLIELDTLQDKIIELEEDVADTGTIDVNFNIASLYFSTGNISGTTGGDATATNVIRTTGWLKMNGGTVITYSLASGYRLGFLFYSSKSTNGYITCQEWLTDTGSVTVPDTANYVRIVIASPSGSSATPSFNDVNLTLSLSKKIEEADFAIKYIDDLTGINEVEWEQGAIEMPNGDEIPHTGRIRTVNVYRVGRNFYAGVASGWKLNIIYFDKYGNYVSASEFFSNSVFVQQSEEYYVRFVFAKSDYSDISIASFDKSNVMVPLPKYTAHTIVDRLITDFDADNTTVAGIYNHLHDVAVKHSNYITENILGNDASGDYELRSYTLGSGSKKIFIVVGQHGPQSDPWDSVVTATRFITQLTDTTYNSDFAEHLRDEYTLCIVPCANPYGLEHFNSLISDQSSSPGGRYNYNAVNLNRDWGTFSQPETQLIKAKMDAIQPDAIIDLHTTGDYLTGSDSIKGKQWTEYTESGMLTMLNALSAKQLQLYNVTLSHNLTTTPSTKLSVWGHSYCEHSMTAECNWWVNGQSEPHSSQIESANMSLLINCIKIMAATIESISYVYERVPKQMQAT